MVEFLVPENQWVKIKECEKMDIFKNLAEALKKLWNMSVTVIPFAIGAVETVHKGLEKRLEG